MPIIYPTTLPQRPNNQDFRATMNPENIVSQFESGPVKTRRKGTKVTEKFNISLSLNSAQMIIFANWYKETLNYGNNTFEWVDFDSGETQNYRFERGSGYDRIEQGALNYLVSFRLESM